MRRPWQIWCLFALCLIVVLPAMGWLTVKAIQLERAEAQARADAEREQDIGLALWRMDTVMTPILAGEAAQPFSVYRPFLMTAAGKAAADVPSPLLKEPSDFVRLHFQIDPRGSWSSPQLPDPKLNSSVATYGLTARKLAENGKLLEQLKRDCNGFDFLSVLPKETLAQFAELALDDPLDDAFGERVALNNSPDDASPDQQPPQILHPRQQAGQLEQAPNAQANDEDSAYQFDVRNRVFQNFGQQAVRQQRAVNSIDESSDSPVAEGVSRPIWIGDQLLFARLVSIRGETTVQGSWLNWSRLKELLLSEASEHLTGANLVPVRSDQPQLRRRMLATLPVALTVLPPEAKPSGLGPIWIALVTAWICLLLTALAIAVLLTGVIRLSERRAAFVSAVTHELRTPLTTFRMYSEMLSQGIVEDPEKRKRYLQTLTVEADRLAHLVENVLAFARLERGPSHAHKETLAILTLLERSESRLNDRAEAARMTLQWDTDVAAETTLIETNCSAIEQILFNLIENACKYAARAEDRVIRVETRIHDDQVTMRVADQGPGIPPDVARRLFRPFHKSSEEAARSAPGVGLGLALCRRLARDLGGDLCLDKSVAHGACFVLRLPL